MRTRVLGALVVLLALVVAMPAAAQTKLKFAHVYETSEAFHAEALWAATTGGALALQLGADRGSLEAGKLADIQIWDVPRYEHAIYRLGGNVVGHVIKRGEVVVERRDDDLMAVRAHG